MQRAGSIGECFCRNQIASRDDEGRGKARSQFGGEDRRHPAGSDDGDSLVHVARVRKLILACAAKQRRNGLDCYTLFCQPNSLLEWRNWQTHGTQNPATFTGHVGSTPTSSTTENRLDALAHFCSRRKPPAVAWEQTTARSTDH